MGRCASRSNQRSAAGRADQFLGVALTAEEVRVEARVVEVDRAARACKSRLEEA
jgi:hypothetical protein